MSKSRCRALAARLCVALLFALMVPCVAHADESKKDPAVTKEVWEESTSSWGHRADASTGTAVRFRLTGTLPHDVYEGYVYRFVDELPEGMTADTGSVSCRLVHDGNEVPVGLDASVDGRTLTIGTDDLHAKAPDAAPGDELVAEYVATLDASSCAYGLDGDNANMVHLEFSQHDLLGNTGLSLADSVRVHTYQLRLRVVPGGTGPVAGVTVSLANPDGKYLTTAGTWVDERGDDTAFVTDEAGEVTFGGVDAATYTIYQTGAPEGVAVNEKPIGVAIKSEGLDGTSVQLGSTTTDPDVSTESVDPASGLIVVVDARGTVEEETAPEETKPTLPVLPLAVGAVAFVAVLGVLIALRD